LRNKNSQTPVKTQYFVWREF